MPEKPIRGLSGKSNSTGFKIRHEKSGVAIRTRGFREEEKDLLPNFRDFKEYHGLEHKVIALLTAGKPITPETIAKTNRVHIRCGSVWGTKILFTPVFSGILILLISSNLDEYVVLHTGLGSYKLLGYIVFSVILSLILAWYLSILVGLLVQRLLLTAEPSEKKVNEALEMPLDKLGLTKKQAK